jgi:hypothetical protein
VDPQPKNDSGPSNEDFLEGMKRVDAAVAGEQSKDPLTATMAGESAAGAEPAPGDASAASLVIFDPEMLRDTADSIGRFLGWAGKGMQWDPPTPLACEALARIQLKLVGKLMIYVLGTHADKLGDVGVCAQILALEWVTPNVQKHGFGSLFKTKKPPTEKTVVAGDARQPPARDLDFGLNRNREDDVSVQSAAS